MEESGIFRYNGSVGHQHTASDQCDIAHFSEPDLSLLMRYQWVLYLILMTAFADRYTAEESRTDVVLQWAALCAAVVLVFDYGISDNIGYSNLEKKYEKTYAYCVRLLDRIEQTPGYYQGIPIALVGVIGYDEFPTTDITGKVTDGMIGLSGDYLIYKGADYQHLCRIIWGQP